MFAFISDDNLIVNEGTLLITEQLITDNWMAQDWVCFNPPGPPYKGETRSGNRVLKGRPELTPIRSFGFLYHDG